MITIQKSFTAIVLLISASLSSVAVYSACFQYDVHTVLEPSNATLNIIDDFVEPPPVSPELYAQVGHTAEKKLYCKNTEIYIYAAVTPQNLEGKAVLLGRALVFSSFDCVGCQRKFFGHMFIPSSPPPSH